MARTSRPPPGSRRGVAALTLAVLLAILTMAIASLVLGGAREHDLAVSRMDTERAYYCAEAGINMALREAYFGADLDGDGGIGSISDDNNPGNNPRIGPADVHVKRTKSLAELTLIARASAGSARHRIEAVVGPNTDGTAPGLYAEYFASPITVNWLAEIDWDAEPVDGGVVSQMNFALTSGQSWPNGPTNNWGRQYTGKVNIPQSGTWTFYTESDDGSEVLIDGVRIVNNDGTHGMQWRSGSAGLSAGLHDIQIRWFERTGSFGLVLYWSGPGVSTPTVVPARALAR